MNKTITEFFTSVGKGYYKPNSGGCGLFAYAASRALDSIGVEHKIVVCCWDSDDVARFEHNYGKVRGNANNQYQKHLAEKKIRRTIHDHIAIQINGVLYDASGVYTPEKGDFKTVIDIRVLKKLVNDRSQWNDTFWYANPHSKTKLHYVARKAEKFSKSLAIR